MTLSGCGTSTRPAVWPILPANLAQSCPPVPEVTSDSWDDLARSYIALVALYGECAARQRVTAQSWEKSRFGPS
ncbi:Rz1-like lysis system protein LysC [Achromobacter xylosoxidans]|uniref:Rz1-like lysis system protein LysC n=1 Tax=Alcaligenes xylosoxydans xylosoxydans TaxID=85698 RepID=UPI003D353A8C